MKSRKLHKCGVCKRPMVFFSPKKDWQKLPKGVKQTVETTGPSTHPRVKCWCYGRCEGLLADIDILVWVLLDEAPKSKRKKLTAWTKDYTEDINSCFVKLIRGLKAGRSS